MKWKEKLKAVTSAYHSICWKLSVGVAIPTLVAMVFSGWYFTESSRKHSIEQYEQQTETVFQTSMKNIDYYLSSCISSSKSVYINDALLTFLRQSGKGFTTSQERDMIFSYLKTVYYSISKAKQIFLAIPQAETSFLYITDNLWASTAHLSVSEDRFPAFTSHQDVAIEPTHHMETYGHVVGFANQKPQSEEDLVFTIWLPVYHLPNADSLAAYLAIDMPVEFIMENCRLDYDETEKVYITDEQGEIIASSDTGVIHQKIDALYPAIGGMDSTAFDSLIDRELLLMQAPMDSRYTDWRIIKAVPVDNVLGTAWNQEKVLVATMLLILVFILAISILQILYYMIPIKQVTSYMSLIVRSRSWKKDVSLSDYVTYKSTDEIGILIDTFGTMLKSIEDYTIREFELELAYIKSTLKMFQAQINPHFIYNTIQCFATNALKNQNPEQYHLISSFGQMLHYAMILEPSTVAFFREVEYVKRYLELQSMRFCSNGEVQWFIGADTDSVMVPRMILQPIVENSFTHGGIFRSPGSVLRIRAEVDKGFMKLCVEDNGEGISQEEIERIYKKLRAIEEICVKSDERNLLNTGETLQETGRTSRESHEYSIGLENVYTRLLLSHRSCEFRLHANEMGGTTTTVCFPVTIEYNTIFAENASDERKEGCT